MTATWPDGPYCECGHCDATGRQGGRPIVLPVEAWEVAGGGDYDRLAVAPGHDGHWPDAPKDNHDRWVCVAFGGCDL